MPTRLAILSDIHSNVFALRGVLADVRAAGVDEVLLLGDLFGYYPWARETWEEVATLSPVSVIGNHDQLVLGAAAGGSLSSVIGPDVLQLAASVGFLVIGTRLLIKASRSDAEPEAEADPNTSSEG